ncbi:hypothetical protein CHS0354_002101 [Potamilus streckersoni]|uniref:Uncharacterized protein n=1 Tax=Potamilus streckersoni TaxID=2493646 RepID=A0AAE0STS9_9BIVA|nr:hypothetical protein CHS0354_002101 [Potamilus streckersoni]
MAGLNAQYKKSRDFDAKGSEESKTIKVQTPRDGEEAQKKAPFSTTTIATPQHGTSSEGA